MRRVIFWLGWTVFLLLPIAFVTEILVIQDLPAIQLWQWAVPLVAVALIVAGRNRDDVLNHHIL